MPPVAITNTEVLPLRSRNVEQEFQVWVARPSPGAFHPLPDRLPVLYVLDADLFFGMAVDMTRIMHRLWGELPPFLVVGIAYGTDEPAVQGELRNRDFTPTPDPAFEEMARRFAPDREPLLPEGYRMGRAGDFLRFLRDEVQPMVAGRYPVDAGSATLFGSSLGGLFASYTLLTEPDAFSHYVLASPSLWWNSGVLFDLEARRAADAADLPASAFLSAGSREEGTGNPMLDQYKLVSNTKAMAERLAGRDYPSLRVSIEIIQGETHTSVVSVALTRGLRALHGRTL